MYQNIKKRTEGFTIIEVLIVLAIAGLIMLIVFLAVPALQRNSRNQSIRNDAGNVLSGVGSFIGNNNGQMPTGVSSSGDGTVTISGGAGTSPVEAKVRSGTTVGYGGPPTGPGTINIAPNFGCNGTGPMVKPRASAALFRVETGSGATAHTPQCIEG